MEDPALFSSSQTTHASEGASDNQNDLITDEIEPVDDTDNHEERGVNASEGDVRNELSGELCADLKGLKVSEHVPAEEPNSEKEQRSLSSEEVDSLLDKCLLQALHTTVKDKDLPMPGSTLW